MATGIRDLRDNLSRRSRFDELVDAGVIRAPLDAGDLPGDWPEIRFPPGTVAELIKLDRGEG